MWPRERLADAAHCPFDGGVAGHQTDPTHSARRRVGTACSELEHRGALTSAHGRGRRGADLRAQRPTSCWPSVGGPAKNASAEPPTFRAPGQSNLADRPGTPCRLTF